MTAVADDGNVIDIQAVLAAAAALANGNTGDLAESNRRFGTQFFRAVKDSSTGRTNQVFLSETLAEAILDRGPLALGPEDNGRSVWSFDGGVWVPAADLVADRATELLGERYKREFAAQSLDHARRMLRRDGKVITADPNPDLINFRNGILNWRTGEFTDHTPDNLSTIQLGTEWDPDAKCPNVEAFVNEVVPADMVETIWELIGYLMFAGNPLQKAVMLIGTGRNGKGTLLRVITSVLGEQNISAVTLQGFAREKFHRAELFNKLANVAGDLDSTYMPETGQFKSITGGDHIYAEYKGQQGFKFRAHAVPVFSANEIPASADATSGYFERWIVIKFPHSFAGREDPGLEARLTTADELRGVAAKAIPALRGLMERQRFAETESAVEAKQEFRRASDPVTSWIEERCHVDPALGSIKRTTMYENYKGWASANGHQALSARKFNGRVLGFGGGISQVRVNGYESFKGVELALPPDPFTDDAAL